MPSYTDTFSSNNFILSVSGIIGVGKSTLAEKLGKELKANVLYEPVKENEYLNKFYKDMSKYSFSMQVYLLNKDLNSISKWYGLVKILFKIGLFMKTLYLLRC